MFRKEILEESKITYQTGKSAAEIVDDILNLLAGDFNKLKDGITKKGMELNEDAVLDCIDKSGKFEDVYDRWVEKILQFSLIKRNSYYMRVAEANQDNSENHIQVIAYIFEILKRERNKILVSVCSTIERDKGWILKTNTSVAQFEKALKKMEERILFHLDYYFKPVWDIEKYNNLTISQKRQAWINDQLRNKEKSILKPVVKQWGKVKQQADKKKNIEQQLKIKAKQAKRLVKKEKQERKKRDRRLRKRMERRASYEQEKENINWYDLVNLYSNLTAMGLVKEASVTLLNIEFFLEEISIEKLKEISNSKYPPKIQERIENEFIKRIPKERRKNYFPNVPKKLQNVNLKF